MVLRVSTEWSRADAWGQIRARLSSFRMRYSVRPGLYAVGQPDDQSPVLASANYKMSFDILRRSLRGRSAWILVLDTNGINVWCAAGKGTFGTEELARRIREARLGQVVSHRRIIVPQLGAPGVSAGRVQSATGFSVLYGPIRADDIPDFLAAGCRASREMRTVRFTLLDRLVLTPMEISPAMRPFALFALVVLVAMGLQPSGILFREMWVGGVPFLALGILSVLGGAFLTPLLLPFLPSKSFAIKGLVVGLLLVIPSTALVGLGSGFLSLAACIFFPLACSYLALQFTGSTTFTSMSGVKRELKVALPVYLCGAALSILLLIAFKLKAWGLL